MAADDDRALIDEQIAYYRARADEYDRTSPNPEDDPFAAAADRIRAALRSFEPRGRVLELAAGTGQWTGLLAEHADDVLATDASPEMLQLNAAKVANPVVRYRVADAFALEATHAATSSSSASSCPMCRRPRSTPSGASWKASWRRADGSSSSTRAATSCGGKIGWMRRPASCAGR